MKKYIFLSSVLAVLTAACSNDNMVQDDKQTPGTSGGLTEFVTGSPVENKTRTSMDYNTGAFFWKRTTRFTLRTIMAPFIRVRTMLLLPDKPILSFMYLEPTLAAQLTRSIILAKTELMTK